MQTISLSRPLTKTEKAAIARFSRKAEQTPFLCLNQQVMLLLTPGKDVPALLEEARRLMQLNLTRPGGVFLHHFPDGTRMLRTTGDLCVLDTRQNPTPRAMLRRGQDVCRSKGMLALVLPDAVSAHAEADRSPADAAAGLFLCSDGAAALRAA